MYVVCVCVYVQPCVYVFQNVHVSVWMCVAVRYLFSITSPVAVWQANSGLPAPSSNGSQPGSAPSAPSAPQVPDIPVVRRARETGYSDEQIAEGIEKLRIIGKTGQGMCWCCCQLERLVSYHWLDWSEHVLMLLSAGAIGQLSLFRLVRACVDVAVSWSDWSAIIG